MAVFPLWGKLLATQTIKSSQILLFILTVVCEEQRETTGGARVGRGNSGSDGGDSNTYHYPFLTQTNTGSSSCRLRKKAASAVAAAAASAIVNKSWRQHSTRHQLYGHLPPITKTIQVRRTRHAGHCWRSRDELISDVLLWTPTYGRAKAGRPARTYIQQLCEDMGCSPEDLPEAMNDREKWRERVRDIRATSTTWWWWWWY